MYIGHSFGQELLRGTRCSAALRFFGPTLDHRVVTAFFGREPSYAHLPGERRNRVGKPYPHGMWLLRSEDHVVSADLEDHLGWLLGQVEGVAHTLLPYLRYLPDNEMVGIRAICNNDLDFFREVEVMKRLRVY
jgi:hypothetical protein